MVIVYLALAFLGAALPLSAFLPWFAQHGLDLPAFAAELFSTRIGAFFGWDVIVSAIVLTLFILVQGRRDHVRHSWIAILATFTIGVSCGLPLFLALRERAVR
jgi:hypothetical protein